MIQSVNDSLSETARTRIPNMSQSWDPLLNTLEDFPGIVSAVIIYNNEFVLDLIEPQLNMKMFYCRSDACFLIPSRDNDG
jgi:hypothetical protein